MSHLFFLQNITAGSAEQIEQVLRANLVPSLVQLMRTGEFDIKKEACWALSNATSGGRAEHLRYLVEQGALPALCDLLSSHDAKIVKVALEAVENLLKVGKKDAERSGQKNAYAGLVEECGGLDKLEALQEHEAEDIYHRSQDLLRVYFGGEEVSDNVMPNAFAPVANANGFSFCASAAVPAFSF
jgi:hypothetical protein